MVCDTGSNSVNKNIGVVATEESEVNIVDCVNNGAVPPVCHNDPDATEHSSSFDDTFTSFEDGLKNDSSEVESNGPSFCGVSNKIFRKKRVSDHWRKYIRHLVWRCRWMELRMKELDHQASRYDDALAVYNKEKQLQMEMSSCDVSAARGVSLTCRRHAKPMKRRKRKRLEETCDIPSYTSNHTIFSYYDKKPEPDRYVDDGLGIQVLNMQQGSINQDDLGVNFEWPMPNVGDFERSLEQLLLEIDSLQSRLLDLTTQLNTTICNNASEIFSNSGTSAPDGPHYSPSLSPKCSPVDNGDAMPLEPTIMSPYPSEFENEDAAMPGSAVSSYGDAAHPDIIESTKDLLSSAISCRGHQVANLGNDGWDDILINNKAVDEELHRITANHPKEARQTLVKEEEDENSARKVSSSETETDIEMATTTNRQLPVPKRCSGLDVHLRRSKRKRKVRKASPGSWIGEKKRRRKNSKK